MLGIPFPVQSDRNFVLSRFQRIQILSAKEFELESEKIPYLKLYYHYPCTGCLSAQVYVAITRGLGGNATGTDTVTKNTLNSKPY